MDYRRILRDDVREEFLDRLDEIAAAAQAGAVGGLEGLEGGLDLDRAADAAARMAEGTWTAGSALDAGLEAIILRFARPVHLVQDGTFSSVADGFPHSESVAGILEQARTGLEAAIPSVGRIELRNHRLAWVGTGWLAAPGLAVTNRHVAQEFAERTERGFAFRAFAGRRTHALVDWHREYLRPREARFRVAEVVWIEPDESEHDVALLRLDGAGEDGEQPPGVIELSTEAEIGAAAAGGWIAVIGYPAGDWRATPADQQRIFDGVFGYKRLAAGRVTAVEPNGVLRHDATTLGGNSGSAVIDLATGKALALHFGGAEQLYNLAVSADAVRGLIAEHGTPPSTSDD